MGNRFAFLVVLLGVAKTATAYASSPKIDDVPILNLGSVHFQVTAVDGLPRACTSGYLQVNAEQTSHSFSICLDDLKSYDPPGNYEFDLQVDPSATSSRRFHVVATPSGRFPDSFAVTKLTLDPEGVEDPQKLRLPVHSAIDQEYLQISSPSIQHVDWFSRTPVHLSLNSQIDEFKLLATSSTLQSFNHEIFSAIFFSQEIRSERPLRVGRNAEGRASSLDLQILPNRWKALRSSLSSVDAGSFDDTLEVHITYHPEMGGLEQTAVCKVPVKVDCGGPLIFAAIFVGGFLGSTVAYLLVGAPHTLRAFLKPMTLGILFAAFAELLALVLEGAGSKLVLFGTAISPQNFYSALLLSFLVAGGPPVVAEMRRRTDLTASRPQAGGANAES